MKFFPSRRTAGTVLCGAILPIVIGSLALGAAQKPKPKATAAPADQYFGKSKMSVVQMNNKIGDLGKRYHLRTIDDTDIVHDAKIVEDSLYAWQKQFPKDPWVLSTLFNLEQLYQVVQSTNARTHATTVLTFIAKAYPTSNQAHLSRLRLAQGFPPLQAETAVTATPNPYAREAAAPDASPSAAVDASAASGAPQPASDASANAAAASASSAASASAAPAASGSGVPAAAASAGPQASAMPQAAAVPTPATTAPPAK